MEHRRNLATTAVLLSLLVFLPVFSGCRKDNPQISDDIPDVEVMTAEGGPSVLFLPLSGTTC